MTLSPRPGLARVTNYAGPPEAAMNRPGAAAIYAVFGNWWSQSDRTDDLLNAIQALSQLSYGPSQRRCPPRPVTQGPSRLRLGMRPAGALPKRGATIQMPPGMQGAISGRGGGQRSSPPTSKSRSSSSSSSSRKTSGSSSPRSSTSSTSSTSESPPPRRLPRHRHPRARRSRGRRAPRLLGLDLLLFLLGRLVDGLAGGDGRILFEEGPRIGLAGIGRDDRIWLRS